MLSDSEDASDSDHDNSLKINFKYAENYEKTKRQQELRKNKELLEEQGAGDEDDDDDDEDDESEDDNAIALSTSLDLEIMKTIESIRNKDPKIYDPTTKWYTSDQSDGDDEAEEEEIDDEKDGEDNDNVKTTRTSKKKTFKDVIREQLLNQENDDENEDESVDDAKVTKSKLSALQYDQEQQELRNNFLRSAKQSSSHKKKENDNDDSDVNDNDDDDDDEELFVAKNKRSVPLKHQEEELERVITNFGQPKDPSQATAINEDDLFLRNYMKEKKWVDNLSNSIKSQSRNNKIMTHDQEDEILDLEEDEKELFEIDQFESKYNFRFEELQNEEERSSGGGLGVVMGHSRQVDGSLRRVDDNRKKQREARKERKEIERKKLEEELRRLKNLKRKEIEERLLEIEKVVGKGFKNNSNLSELLDEDWDPEKYEREMASQFNDDYYNENDDEFHPPDNSDLLNEDNEEGYDYPPEGEYDDEDQYPHNEDEENEEEEVDDENNQHEKQIEEALYQYDYEDLVGGIPCRFKYRQVEKEDYGLTIDDILDADDVELNSYVGLKSIVGYSDRNGNENNLSERQIKKQKKLAKKRKQLLKSLNERREEEKKKKEGKNLTKTQPISATPPSHSHPLPPPPPPSTKETNINSATVLSETKLKRKRSRNKNKNIGNSSGNKIEDEGKQETETGEGHNEETEESLVPNLQNTEIEVTRPIKKKKREHQPKPVSAVKRRMDLYS